MFEADVESYYLVSTRHSTLSQQSLSQYSLQPSETAVDVAFDVDADENGSVASTLSLVTCATSVSEYSCPPSETNVSMSQLEFDRGHLQSALFFETDQANVAADVDDIGSVASSRSLITCATSVSEYSCPPSETNVSLSQLEFDRGDLQSALLFETDQANVAAEVDDIGSVASSLSLITCATSVSKYSCPPSETNVSMSQLEFDREDLQSAPFIDTDEADGFVYSSYDLGPAETNVEIENCEMLYPQRFIPQLFAPERAECDTPAPPQMFAAVVSMKFE